MEHPIIQLNSNYETYKYKIFAIFIVDAKDESETKYDCWNQLELDTEEEFYNLVNEAKRRTIYTNDVDVKYGDGLLSLSTCQYLLKDRSRLMIMARTIRPGEDEYEGTQNSKRNDNIKWPTMYYNSKKDEKDDEEEKPEEEEDKKDYQALYAELSAKYESLETKYDEALNSLNKYTKKEKLEIINKFSTKLESEELIEKLTNEVDNYSLEEIKTELGHALVEQMSAEEDAAEETSPEANFSLNINIADNNLGNTAWDLVKRHKQGK